MKPVSLRDRSKRERRFSLPSGWAVRMPGVRALRNRRWSARSALHPGVAPFGFRSATRRSPPQSPDAAARSRGSAVRTMASGKLLRFQFPEHEGVTLQRMNQLRMEEWFCDVTIVVGGLRFPGHRVVLAACSPFLRDRFHMDPSREVQVCPMAGAEVVLRLLLSCYTGSLEFPFRDIVDYLAAASCLQMEHVVEKCRQSLSPCVASVLTEEGDGRPATPQIASSSSGRAPDAWPGPESGVKQENGRQGCAQTPLDAPSEPEPRIHSTMGPAGAGGGGGGLHEDESSAGPTDDLPEEDYGSPSSEGLQRGGEEPAPPQPPSPEGPGAEPVRCSECGAAFEQREQLAAHMVKHRLYLCLLCDKVFRKNARLAQHINVHTGFKPHCCTVCGRTFTQKRSLKDHMNLHNGDAPHCCNYCDMRFTHYNTLRVHLRDQHGKTTTSNSSGSRLAEIKVVVP
ncbi:zinc finger and BTB domain-containing protein 26-like isoform X1 [Hemitrygon akajei]|uniref:zinc finger and BTB domain-containing protein 26-like isoform X1 n=2 Tax=Hemitrygon akajei TaxID=2704970 RepID=UPI003BFA04D5